MGLGDDMMWLGEAEKIHKQNKDCVVHDGNGYSSMWKGHDWVVTPDYNGPKNKILVPSHPNGNRWYIEGWGPGKINYKDYQPKPAPYIVSKEELERAEDILKQHGVNKHFVIVNPDTKNTTLSTNKDWGFDRWQELTNLLSDHIQVVRVKPGKSISDVSGHVEYGQKMLDNAINIVEDDVRVAFAIMSLSSVIVTSEGGVHHFAAAVQVPAYVIYGGVIHPDQTGYTGRDQMYYFVGDKPCGSQIPCNHCRDAMAAIKPQMIYEDVLEEIDGI